MELREKDKATIVELLEAKILHVGGQNKVARILKGVSPATLTHVRKDYCWSFVSDAMWRNIGAQVGWRGSNWKLVETTNFVKITSILTDAKQYSNVLAIISPAGSCKTATCRDFADKNKDVYLLECTELWNRKAFLIELLRALGRDTHGMSVMDLMGECLRILKTLDKPLLVFDEVDKLNDQVLHFFISFYNNLEDHCGIALLSTNYMEKRMKLGIQRKARGYQEIHSRLGRKFIELGAPTPTDIAKVCIANGIENKAEINRIIKGGEDDMRRVKRMIHATLRKIAEAKNTPTNTDETAK